MIRIIGKQTNNYWYFIDKKFDTCPSGEFSFATEFELDRVKKANWVKISRCKFQVKITNTSIGTSKKSWPIKIRKTKTD